MTHKLAHSIKGAGVVIDLGESSTRKFVDTGELNRCLRVFIGSDPFPSFTVLVDAIIMNTSKRFDIDQSFWIFIAYGQR